MSTLPLVFVMFFNVSGGAYSLEQLVASSGAGLAIIILAAIPVLWSVPEVLIVGELVVADVVLYSLTLFVEFAALIQFRLRQPELRGHFRIPVGTTGVVLLARLPVAILLLVITLGVRDGTYALPALIGSLGGVLAGPLLYLFVRRRFA